MNYWKWYWKYSRAQITRILKESEKQFELAGPQVIGGRLNIVRNIVIIIDSLLIFRTSVCSTVQITLISSEIALSVALYLKVPRPVWRKIGKCLLNMSAAVGCTN